MGELLRHFETGSSENCECTQITQQETQLNKPCMECMQHALIVLNVKVAALQF